MRDEEGQGPVSLSVSPFSWMSGQEGPVSLSVSSMSCMCKQEGPVSLSVSSDLFLYCIGVVNLGRREAKP